MALADDTMEGGPVDGDRRQGWRHLACFPAYLEVSDGEQRSAIIQDLSVTGALLLTRAPLRRGDLVRLSLYFSDGDAAPAIVAGTVVRAEPAGDGTTLWSYAVGIRFDSPALEHERVIKELADKQAASGLFDRPARPAPKP